MNPTNLDRRRFLAASATASLALIALPERLLAAKAEDVVLRFAVMSDVHYSGRPNTPEPGRFKKALAFMNEYAAEQSYPKFDALLVAGENSTRPSAFTTDNMSCFTWTAGPSNRGRLKTFRSRRLRRSAKHFSVLW